jgi:Fe-Mn family superoxide dismutase
MTYTPKTFTLTGLAGISDKQIAVHLALYEGYVKHVNLILEKLAAVREGTLELDPYLVAELRRRLAFEFNGMRLHELYFEQFRQMRTSSTQESSTVSIAGITMASPMAGDSPLSQLSQKVNDKYGSEEKFVAHVKEVAGTRGIGWVIVYYDKEAQTVHTTFVADHEVGQLAGLPILLALDLWEHAYMVDYVPADKKNYIDAFFANLDWSVMDKRFDATNSAA